MRRILLMIFTTAVAGLAVAGGPPAQAGGGCHNDVFSDEANTQVELSKNCFEPTVVRVEPGQQVTWTNSDPDPHTVTGAANTWGNGEDKILAGESVTYQFDDAGVFPYFCFFHPSMVGAVVVGDGRAVSTGADDGVKAVSAQAAGGQADEPEAKAIGETDDRDSTVPLVIGVGVLAAMTGFAGAFVLRRKASGSE